MLYTLLFNILNKIPLIISFSLIANLVKSSGALTYISGQLLKNANAKKLIIGWYIISCIFSAFFNDMISAAFLIPIALQHGKKINFDNLEILVLTIVFGISAGGDLTIFGGNDNLAAFALMQGTKYELTKLGWTAVFSAPTICISIIGLLVCLYGVRQDNWYYFTKVEEKYNLNKLEFIVSVILIILAFYINSYVLLALSLLVNIIDKIFNFSIIPYKAIAIWTLAFVVSKLISGYIPTIEITNTSLLFGILILITNVFTNTAIISAVVPILMAANLTPAIFYVAIKACNIAFLTIYSNSCFAVASGYGVKQKTLLLYGAPMVIGSYIILLLYLPILQQFV